jgi:hypothetical protein
MNPIGCLAENFSLNLDGFANHAALVCAGKGELNGVCGQVEKQAENAKIEAWIPMESLKK